MAKTEPEGKEIEENMPPREGQVVQSVIEQSIADAEILIRFACLNASDPKPISGSDFSKLIDDILSAREKFKSNNLKVEDEAKFFEDYRTLSKSLLPVTLRSIQDSVLEHDRNPRRGLLTRRMSRASAAAARFTFLSVVSLAILLGVQIVWLFGVSLTDQIVRLSKREPSLTEPFGSELYRENEVTRVKDSTTEAESSSAVEKEDESNELRSADEVANSSAIPPPMSSEPSGAEILANRNKERTAALLLLERWWAMWPGTRVANTKDSDLPATEQVAQNNSILISSRSIIEVLGVYVLPLLYGLMGACTFVLRKVVQEGRARRFRSEDEVAYWVRVFLGMLAGLAIGWFLRPPGGDVDIQVGTFTRVSPFALSFIAGYSVELLFSAMDRLVGAFGDRDGKEFRHLNEPLGS